MKKFWKRLKLLGHTIWDIISIFMGKVPQEYIDNGLVELGQGKGGN